MSATVAPIVLLVDDERVIVSGRLQALVGSKSTPGEFHSVSWEEEEGWVCTCPGFGFRKRCRHVVAIRRWLAGKAQVAFPEDAE